MITNTQIHDRVKRALSGAGSTPWLYGYDVVGIQDFIGARSRPIAMRGASESVIAVDREHQKLATNIFSGGGRGVGIAPSQKDALGICEKLTTQHRNSGGVLATAMVPFQVKSERDCLTWLRYRLEVAKDEALPPPGRPPEDKAGQCENCCRFPVEPNPTRTHDEKRVCLFCDLAIRLGRKIDPQMRQSLSELSPSKRIAAVSADGNGMGRFFDSLQSLEQFAVASESIAGVFRVAHEAAMARLAHPGVPLVTGGDDIRVFLAVEDVLPYVTELVRKVEETAEQTAKLLQTVLPRASVELLRTLGIGVGVVVAEDHHPAEQLLEYAHLLEDSAKVSCQVGSPGSKAPLRSALDLEVLTSRDAFSAGQPERSGTDERPFSLDRASWESARQRASALAQVPPSQLSTLAASRTMDEHEFRNFFRYQVARNHEWQRYLQQTNMDWRKASELDKGCPGPGLLALLRLMRTETRP